MKVPLSWLKEYVAVTIPVADLADRLTMAGNEVKVVQVTGGNWENILVGQIVEVSPHPNADRLRLATVDLGGERQTVVCGAPNLTVGDKIAFARVDAQLIDPHTSQTVRLKPAKIRGVLSAGMVCSERELGISDSHEGIMVLAPDAPVGWPLLNYLGDAILDLEVTPNRPDCLSVIGVAREAAALTGQPVNVPEPEYDEAAVPIGQHIAVEILDPDLCPRYCASLIRGVKIAESPKWMQHRLLACGMRPINNIVDITNYVMLEYGQPLHSFDYARIRGQKIIVRRARDGEAIITLDGAERVLASDNLVIADVDGAVAVAGVMGGANSEVTELTTAILLEAASFKPTSIHYTGRKLGMPSEACMRFERGIPAGVALPALRRATQLILQVAGGETAKGIIDVFPGKTAPAPVPLTAAEAKRVLGIAPSLEQISGVLTSLGCEVRPGASADAISVTAPYWRADIRLPVDLVEEYARITGYDRIPLTMLATPVPRHNPDPMVALKEKMRLALAGSGFHEVITYSLVGRDGLAKTLPTGAVDAALRLLNPMTADLEYLRPSLHPNLLAALAANRRHEEGGIRLFELGRVYLPHAGDLPEEPETLCGILSGPRADKSWLGGDGAMDFYDARGVIEALFARLGMDPAFRESSDPGLHPKRQAAVLVGATPVSVVGELHPKVIEGFEIAGTVAVFDLNLAALLPFTLAPRPFQPIPRFPAVVRDIALVVDATTPHQKVLDIIQSFSLVTQVALFDLYTGEQVPPGKKSLAYRLTFQSPAQTLTDEEVNSVLPQLLGRLAGELGSALRG